MFEELSELNPGDKVILTKITKYSAEMGFEKGTIYTLEFVDTPDNSYRYMIKLENQAVWFKRDSIRKATPEEIEANKYNL